MRYRYRSYEELKDSGVEWLGKIPKDWEVGKFKYSSLLYTGNSIKDNEKDNYTDSESSYPYISTKDINIDYNTINYDNGMYTKVDDKTFKIANKDSILICIEGGSAGRKISYLNQNVSFVNKLCCIQSSKVNSKFQYYYCNSDSFKKEFSLNMSGLIGGVSVSSLNNFRLVNPSLFEQEKISNFLDEKTSQFDLIISKKEKLIERLEEAKKSLISEVVTGKIKVVKTDDGYELIKRSSEEMKDSGVEWLGEIPKDWEKIKLKYVTNKIIDGVHHTPTYVDEGIPFLRVTDITKLKLGEEIDLDKVNFIPEKEHKELIKRCKPEKGDLLLSKNGTIGITKVIDWDYEFSIFVSLCLIKPIQDRLYNKFCDYFFKSDLVTEQISNGGKTSTITNLHLEKIKEFFLLLPNLEVQKLIAEYLDVYVYNIENLISKVEEEIELLKQAKQSLISEAVTGKIEILD